MILGYKHYREVIFGYGFILSVTIIAFVVRMSKFTQIGTELNIRMTIVSFFVVAATWELLRLINRVLDKYLPFEKDVTQRVIIQLLLGGVIGLIVRFGIYYFGEPHLPFKLDELFLAATWFLYLFFPTAINLGFFTSYFLHRWRDSLVNAERLEKEKSKVQFDNLKNQLNPHFLFNALTSLNSLIFEDQALASRFLQQLSKVYRYVLQHKDKTLVNLQTELDFIEHYVSLLNTRFKTALNISFRIDESAKELSIVPVTLQILIENALKHNVIDNERPLALTIASEDHYLVVRNNVQLKRQVEESNKLGLDNLRSLYSYLTDRPVMIEDDGMFFSVRIPLL
jgi:two-component system, LytTR family, sensor kinase